MAAHAVESSSPASTAGATAKPRPRRRRPDIEGLRAVAVLLVIADHLASEPAGGFIGVDVFFVISGFLITGLLVREARATGRISLLNFYGRRFRRIVPAAVLVLAVTAYAAHLIFIAARADKVRTDALFAAVFGANWHFAATGTDYFQQGVTVSPLQHYWSLSVEEQFYVLWPWVVLLLVLAERRLARRVGPALTLGVTMALTAVSFEWAVHESGRSPVAAYFSSFDRAWELGVGACLAVLSAALNRLPAWLRPPIAYSGLAAIAVAAVTITSTTTFSPPWAAVAVGGAALVIMAGSGAQSYRYLWVLTNPLATWIGALSYSLYLWHYPVIIFAQALVARRDAAFYLGVCAVTVALSVVSYYVIEDPIRRSSLLAPRSHRPAHLLRTNTGRARRADRSARWRAGFVAAAVAIVAAVLTVSAAREGTSSRPIAFSDPASNSSSGSPGSTAPPPSELPPISGADIRRALTTPAWPAIDLSEDGIHRLQNPDLSTHCLANFTDTEGGRCDSGAAPGTTHAVLFGDSIALAWAATVRAAFPTWHVSSFAKSTCPWINALIDVPAVGPYSACLQWHRFVYRSLAELQPDVIFVSNAEHQLNALYPRPARALRDKTWSRDARTTIAHLERITHARIVYLAAPPGIEPIATCATKFNTPKDCIGTVSADWDRSIADIRRATARDPRVKVIDTSSWFCVARRCPPIFQGVPVRSDDVHMTALYGERIAPNFALALARATPALTR